MLRNIVSQVRGVSGRLAASPALIVQVEEGFIFADWAAKSAAVLILSQRVRQGRRLKKRTCVEGAILQVVIYRTVKIVGAGLGDDVHDAAERTAIIGAKAVVDDAKFLHRILRWRRALNTAEWC